jgi:c(7)-type cytochrome triheme protein
MKFATVLLFLAALAVLPSAIANEKVFPVRMVIPASQGGVTFHHFLHAQRVKFECSVCHASLWPQDTGASLGYSPAGHQTAEDRRAGCGSCHHEGGSAFSSQGNCTTRCHSKYAGDSRPVSGPAAKTAAHAATIQAGH